MSIPDYLDSALAASERKIEEYADMRRALADVALLDKQYTDAEQARRAAESRLSEAQGHLARVKAEARRLEEINHDLLDQEQVQAANVKAVLRDANLREGEYASDIEVLGKQVVALQKRHRETTSNLESLRNARASAAKRAEEGRLHLERLRGRWQGAGLQGDPSAESLQAAIDMANDRQQRLEQCELRHGALVESYEKWIRSREYRELQQRVSEGMARHRVATEAAATEALEARLAAARGVLESVRQAHQFRDTAIKKLEAEAKHYANSVLKPLDDLNKSFLHVFSCFSNITVSLGARTRQSSSHLEFMLSWLTDPDDSSYASIRHFLSEGQLSALSVSLLLSMSTAYRWSRWRALVLDDPLQHNDVIQASSFTEVLRNLIREQGYQVMLSTHDYQLANFIRRKMAAADVDCRTCQFLGTRWQGVTHKVIY